MFIAWVCAGERLAIIGHPNHFQSVYVYSFGLGPGRDWQNEGSEVQNRLRRPKITLKVSMFIAWVWGRGETGQNRSPKITLRVAMFIAWVWGRGETGQNRSPKIPLRVAMFIAWVWGRGETGHNRPPKITLRAAMFIAWVWGRGETGKMSWQNGFRSSE